MTIVISVRAGRHTWRRRPAVYAGRHVPKLPRRRRSEFADVLIDVLAPTVICMVAAAALLVGLVVR